MSNTKLPTPKFGLDSTSMIPVAGHRSVGSSFAGRYLSRLSWKVVTQAEVEAYEHNGIELILFFEDGATNALAGEAQGISDAKFAMAQAESFGIKTGAIFMTVDDDVAPSAVDAYFDGAMSVLGDRCGVYGSYAVVMRQMARGVRYGCQTIAWSHGQLYSGAQLYQFEVNLTVDGVGADGEHAYFEDYGQVWYTHPKPADPNHYRWFYTVELDGKQIDEAAVAEEYDRLRAEQTFLRHPHRARLKVLRATCTQLADRIKKVAAKGAEPAWGTPEPGLGVFHRQWRLEQLEARAAGKRVAK